MLVAPDHQVVVCRSGGVVSYAVPHSVLFVLLRLFGVDLVEHGVPPGGRGEFSCCLNLFVSVGGFGHFPSVPLCTGLPPLIFCGFLEFRFCSFQVEVVCPLSFDGHVRSLGIGVLMCSVELSLELLLIVIIPLKEVLFIIGGDCC